MAIDEKLLDQEKPRSDTINLLKQKLGQRQRFRPWDELPQESSEEIDPAAPQDHADSIPSSSPTAPTPSKASGGKDPQGSIKKSSKKRKHSLISQTGTTNGHKRAQESDQTGTNGHNSPVLSDQTGTVPISDEVCAHLKEELCPFDEDNKRAQTGTVPISDEVCAHLKEELCPFETGASTSQTGTTNGHKWAQQTGTNGHNVLELPLGLPDKSVFQFGKPTVLPTSNQQLHILRFIFNMQQQTGLACSPRLKRDDIAKNTSVSPVGIKSQLDRLCSEGLIERVSSLRGRGDAGTVYRIPPPIVQALHDFEQSNGHDKWAQMGTTNGHKWAQAENINGHDKWAQLASSSSNLNTTTTNGITNPFNQPNPEKELCACLVKTLEREGLDGYGVGANDLLQLVRDQTFQNVEDLGQSLSHLAFYLQSDSARGIQSPKGWIMKQLKQGYYAAPAGYKSREERQAAAKLEDTRKRLEAITKIRQQQLEAESDIWIMGLDEEKKRSYLPPGVKADSVAARAVLRQAYAKENGFAV
jgi:hypothetical protein